MPTSAISSRYCSHLGSLSSGVSHCGVIGGSSNAGGTHPLNEIMSHVPTVDLHWIPLRSCGILLGGQHHNWGPVHSTLKTRRAWVLHKQNMDKIEKGKRQPQTCTIVFRGVSFSPPLFSTAIGVRETSSVADLKWHMSLTSCFYNVESVISYILHYIVD